MTKFNVPFLERKDILQFSYELAHKEYNDLWEAWKLLEAKAQATLATAGIFEAGAFAYITQAKPSDVSSKLMLMLLVVVLAAAVYFGVRAIQVRDHNTPFEGVIHADILSDVRAAQPMDSLSDMHAKWLVLAIELCTDANDKLHPKLVEKGKNLTRAFRALIVASLLVVPLVAWSLFSIPTPTPQTAESMK
jgi:hypothetical protein